MWVEIWLKITSSNSSSLVSCSCIVSNEFELNVPGESIIIVLVRRKGLTSWPEVLRETLAGLEPWNELESDIVLPLLKLGPLTGPGPVVPLVEPGVEYREYSDKSICAFFIPNNFLKINGGGPFVGIPGELFAILFDGMLDISTSSSVG
jgi:hypothetical protein